MKSPDRSILLPVLTGVIALASASAVQAQDERARVLSSTPIIQQVATPREVCQNQTVAYDVVYEYAGRRYNVQMPEEPGRYVQVNVQPVIAAPAPRQQMQYRPALPAEPEVVTIGGTREYPEVYRGHRQDRDNEQWDRNWR